MHTRHPSRGFTLIELGIVLIVLSVLLGGTLQLMTQNLRRAQIAETNRRMDVIEEALVNFAKMHSYLPCPAILQLPITNTGWGFDADGEYPHMGGCTQYHGGYTIVIYHDTFTYTRDVAAIGMIPVRTLGLPDIYGFDAWGYSFTYVIDPLLTDNMRNMAITQARGASANFTGHLKIWDLGGFVRTDTAVMVLISRGPDGECGYTVDGIKKPMQTTNAYEQSNCVPSPPIPAYMQDTNTFSATDTRNVFDDIVRYNERSRYWLADDKVTERMR